MTNKELLEYAAKASGMRLDSWKWFGAPVPYFVRLYEGAPTMERWNPLTSDGDALRLVVKLGMALNIRRNDVFAGNGMHGVKETMDSFDPYDATRRAIVRAAAEIGKAMP